MRFGFFSGFYPIGLVSRFVPVRAIKKPSHYFKATKFKVIIFSLDNLKAKFFVPFEEGKMTKAPLRH